MTRKRFIKLLMGYGMEKRLADKKACEARSAQKFESYQSEYKNIEGQIDQMRQIARKNAERLYKNAICTKVNVKLGRREEGAFVADVICCVPVTSIEQTI